MPIPTRSLQATRAVPATSGLGEPHRRRSRWAGTHGPRRLWLVAGCVLVLVAGILPILHDAVHQHTTHSCPACHSHEAGVSALPRQALPPASPPVQTGVVHPRYDQPAGDTHESPPIVRGRIAEMAKIVFDRHLTDAAGGNISVRVGELVCITPRFSGSKRRWHLQPNEVLVSDLSGNKLDGDGEISREARVHFALYNKFPDATAVLHSHARNAMAFVAAGQPIEPILEATLKFGTIPVSRFSPAHSEKLAEAIVESFQGRDEAIRKYAAAVIAPWHGLFTVGRDLDASFDLTERIDTNA